MRRGRPPYDDILTPREWEVLGLMREGLTNEQIAGRLGITQSGAKYHVGEILSKLGVSSRSEAAAWDAAAASRGRRGLAALLPSGALPLKFAMVAAGMAVAVGGAALLVLAIGVQLGMNGQEMPAGSDDTQEKLAFIRDGDLWTKDLPDGTPTRLTRDAPVARPKWSSDGDWLTVERLVMRADGSDVRPLGGEPVWSPAAGDELAYIAGDALQVERADGSQKRTLVTAKAGEELSTPVWSPDGSVIAFSRWTRNGDFARGDRSSGLYSGLWRVDVQSGAASELTGVATPPDSAVEAVGPLRAAAWSADGRDVFFWRAPIFSGSFQADGWPLWVVPASGGEAVALTTDNTLVYEDFVAAAPDGQALLAVVGGGRNSWAKKVLTLLDARGGARALTTPNLAAVSPAWSPDGERIAYVAAPAADYQTVVGGEPARLALAQRRIWTMNADGSAAMQLTDDPLYRDEAPVWSADGASIFFARIDGEDRSSLWMVSPSGGPPVWLADISAPMSPGATLWFGYYGHVDWTQYFDIWRP